MKVCCVCLEEKDISRFSVYKIERRKGKLHGQCKDCMNKKRSLKRKQHPGIWSDIERRARYRYKYGLDEKDVLKFGTCPICLRDRRLVVDHCHTNGHVRGFICSNCNTLLGHIENQIKMERINKYLRIET